MPRRAGRPQSIVPGGRIRESRRAAGISQADLSDTIAIDRTALSKIESGRRRVSSQELERIARALGRPLEWFFSQPPATDSLRAIRRKRNAVLRIARKHGARSVRLFGSAARGEAGPDSDIDLLVEMDRGRSLFDQAALLIELRELLGRDVDVVTPQGLRDRMRERVLAEAVPL